MSSEKDTNSRTDVDEANCGGLSEKFKLRHEYDVHFPPAEYGEQSEGREGRFPKQRQHMDKWLGV